tara:strand:- start:1063 stop:2592 length:1530 start_codon:yes stop_codon:yes gene_type:complete
MTPRQEGKGHFRKLPDTEEFFIENGQGNFFGQGIQARSAEDISMAHSMPTIHVYTERPQPKGLLGRLRHSVLGCTHLQDPAEFHAMEEERDAVKLNRKQKAMRKWMAHKREDHWYWFFRRPSKLRRLKRYYAIARTKQHKAFGDESLLVNLTHMVDLPYRNLWENVAFPLLDEQKHNDVEEWTNTLEALLKDSDISEEDQGFILEWAEQIPTTRDFKFSEEDVYKRMDYLLAHMQSLKAAGQTEWFKTICMHLREGKFDCMDHTAEAFDNAELEMFIQRALSIEDEQNKERALMSVGLNAFIHGVVREYMCDYSHKEPLEDYLYHLILLNEVLEFGLTTQTMYWPFWAKKLSIANTFSTFMKACTAENIANFFEQWEPWRTNCGLKSEDDINQEVSDSFYGRMPEVDMKASEEEQKVQLTQQATFYDSIYGEIQNEFGGRERNDVNDYELEASFISTKKSFLLEEQKTKAVDFPERTKEALKAVGILTDDLWYDLPRKWFTKFLSKQLP